MSETNGSATKRAYRPTDYRTRVCMLYDFRRGISAGDCARQIQEAFGEAAVNVQGVRNWFYKFKNGNTDIGEDKSAIPKAEEGAAIDQKPRKKKSEGGGAAAVVQKKPRVSEKAQMVALQQSNAQQQQQHTIKVEAVESGYVLAQLQPVPLDFEAADGTESDQKENIREDEEAAGDTEDEW